MGCDKFYLHFGTSVLERSTLIKSKRHAQYQDPNEKVDNCLWMLEILNNHEQKKLDEVRINLRRLKGAVGI